VLKYLVVGGIVPYSYHNIQKYGFCSHHSYPNSGYCLGLTLLSSSFGDSRIIIDTMLYNNFSYRTIAFFSNAAISVFFLYFIISILYVTIYMRWCNYWLRYIDRFSSGGVGSGGVHSGKLGFSIHESGVGSSDTSPLSLPCASFSPLTLSCLEHICTWKDSITTGQNIDSLYLNSQIQHFLENLVLDTING
jgi:hypothetical protein